MVNENGTELAIFTKEERHRLKGFPVWSGAGTGFAVMPTQHFPVHLLYRPLPFPNDGNRLFQKDLRHVKL